MPVFLFCAAQYKIFVSANGKDKNRGTIQQPFKTLEAAVKNAVAHTGKDVVIEIKNGTYDLANTIDISADNYLVRSLSIQPYLNDKVIVSGSKKINLQWQLYKDGIVKAPLDIAAAPDQLFINGKALHMARYPNYDATARVFNGTAPDAISNERIAS